ncbi:MAG: acyl--CoA ligase [Solirubrobacterales bacterium]|nr:acyl--CoA ligase [Solirubrobacterales bacterium]
MPSSDQIGPLLGSALAEGGDAVALACPEGTLSYRELRELADLLAASLRVQPGDRVAVVAPNVPGLIVALLAAWKLGAVAVPLNARLRSFELGRAFASVQPAAAVSLATHGRFELAREILAQRDSTPTLGQAVVIDSLGNQTEERSWSAERDAPLPEDVAAVLFTSGSTGEPKAALVSHRQARAQAENLPPRLEDLAGRPAALVSPATHSFGMGCLLATLASRGTLIMIEMAASVAPLIEALRRFEARLMHGSPALFVRLLAAASDLNIRGGFTAGSSCPPSLLERLDEQGVRLLNLYGMSEIGAACCPRQDDPPEVRYRTVGRPLRGFELRIAPHPAGNREVGEIEVRSDCITPRYLNRAWTSNDTPGEGWFRTGDLGSVDGDGNMTVAGRCKEVVHVGGFNVFPAEVESFLLTHPDIALAAVIGAPHPVMGEVPQAFVVPERGAALEAGDVVRFARAGIAGYKVPYAVKIVDQLPTMTSGKLDRTALTQMLDEGTRTGGNDVQTG